jgi:hypothetical protein
VGEFTRGFFELTMFDTTRGTERHSQLPSFLLAFFERFEKRVNGLKLGCKNCPTLGSVGKALF